MQSMQSTKVDLPEKTSTVSYATITLPENINELELFVPELGFDTDFQISGFTEHLEDFESWETAIDSQRTSYSKSQERNLRDSTNVIETLRDEEKTIPEAEKFDINSFIGESPKDISKHDTSKDKNVPSPMEGNDEYGQDFEHPEFEYHDNSNIKQLQFDVPKKKRKGLNHVIIDSEIEIDRTEYEQNINNTDDIVREVIYVPKTKELLLLGNKRTLNGMFKYPVLDCIPDVFDSLYENNLEIKKVNVENLQIEQPRYRRESHNNDIVFEGNDQFMDEDIQGFDNNNINLNPPEIELERTPQNISIIEKESEKKNKKPKSSNKKEKIIEKDEEEKKRRRY